MQPRCTGRTKAGAPCQAPAMSGGRYCVTHDPARVTDLVEWRRKGGQGKSSKARARKTLPGNVLTADELRGLVGLTIKRVLAGATEPAIGNSVAALARAYVAVTEATTIEERLSELEKAAGVSPKGWTG